MATDAEILAAGELNYKSLAGLGVAVGDMKKQKQAAADAEFKKAATMDLADKFSKTTFGQTEQGQMESLGMAYGLNDPKDAIARFSGMKPEELAGIFALNLNNIKDPKAMQAATKALDIFKEYQGSLAYWESKGKAEGGNFSYSEQAKKLEAESDAKGGGKLKPAMPIDGDQVSTYLKNMNKNDDDESFITITKAGLPGFEKDADGSVEIDLNKGWPEIYSELKAQGTGKLSSLFTDPYSDEQILSIKQAYFTELESQIREGVLEAAPYLDNPVLKQYLDAAVGMVGTRVALMGADRAAKGDGENGQFNYDLGQVPEIAYRYPNGSKGAPAAEIPEGWAQKISRAPIEELKDFVYSHPEMTDEVRAQFDEDLTGDSLREAAAGLIQQGYMPQKTIKKTVSAPKAEEGAPAEAPAAKEAPAAEGPYKPQSKAEKKSPYFGKSGDAAKITAEQELPKLKQEAEALKAQVEKEGGSDKFGRRSSSSREYDQLVKRIKKLEDFLS